MNKSAQRRQKDIKKFKQINFNAVIPSPPDDRDFSAPVAFAEHFPDEFVSANTTILDQGIIGSCVAHSCATLLSKAEITKTTASYKNYSRGYIYGNRRDTDLQEEGMIIREALKQLNKCGDVLYKDFPYNEEYLKVKTRIAKDKDSLAKKALPYAIENYFRCSDTSQIKRTIIKSGGVIICVPVYSDFSCDLTLSQTNILEGYHAMVIIGWTKDNKWIVQNSWGKSWGYSGTLLMDMNYPIEECWGITLKDTTESEDIQEPPTILTWLKIGLKLLVKLLKK